MVHIRLDKVHVDLPIFQGSERRLLHPGTIRASLGGLLRRESNQHVVVSALRDISLNVNEGDRLGLIGHNGAGKTTLLRLMAGIFAPQKGVIETAGNIATMFNINLGLEKDATGYENIRFMSMLNGLSPVEAEAAVPEIEAFSELGEFLHLPVRTYSTGMLMRLVFTVATYKQPEIVILDEIIGAGDSSFQKKVKERLTWFFEKTSIMVLASHSEGLIREYCNRVVVLDHGEITFTGDVEEGLRFYARSLLIKESDITYNISELSSHAEQVNSVNSDDSYENEPYVFGLIGPWLRENEEEEVKQAAEEYLIEKAVLIRTIISNFTFTFRSLDKCELHIGIPQRGVYPQIEVVEKWIEMAFSKASYPDLPTIKIVIIEDEVSKKEFYAGCSNLIEKITTPVDLYYLLKEIKGLKNLSYFDVGSVVDKYDCFHTSAVRNVREEHFSGAIDADNLINLSNYCHGKSGKIRSLLDVGCGAGAVFFTLESQQINSGAILNYSGVDLSREQVFRAQKNFPEGQFLPGSAVKLKWPDEAFDLVICYSVLQYISSNDQLKALRELFRVSSEGVFATFIIDSTPNGLLSINDIPNEMYQPTDEKIARTYAIDADAAMAEVSKNDSVQVQVYHRLFVNEKTGLGTYSENDTGAQYERYLEIMNNLDSKDQEAGHLDINGNPMQIFEGVEVFVFPNDFKHQKQVGNCQTLFWDVG